MTDQVATTPDRRLYPTTRLTAGRRRARSVVMADVARLAGVSQQTVSRVLNDSPHVRPDTRERVLDAVRKLGYRPQPRRPRARHRPLANARRGVLRHRAATAPPRRCSASSTPRTSPATSSASPACARSSPRSVLSAVERLDEQGVDGILVIAPQESAARALRRVRRTSRSSPPRPARRRHPAGRGRPDRRRRAPPRSTCSTSAIARSGTSPARATGSRRRTACAAGARRSRIAGAVRAAAARGRLERALGLRAGGTAGHGRRSPPCSSPTTRWRWASCGACTSSVAGSRRRSVSSASTTSQRRPTSRRR